MNDLPELARKVQIAAEAISSGQVSDNLELLRAIRNLNRVVESPVERVRRIVYQPVQTAALRLAVEIGLPQALVEAETKSITATELAVKTGASHLLIVSTMRILSAIDIIDEIGPEYYASNTITETLTSPTWISGTRCIYDTLAPCSANLVNYYKATKFLTPQPLFTYATTQDFWTFLHSHNLHTDFLTYMQGRKDGEPRWLDYFPIQSQIDDLRTDKVAVTLVDIGGNLGHDLVLFKKRWPGIGGRVVLEDLKEVVDANEVVLEGIEKVEYDFFTPQPIKGAKFYLFRAICHDWPDAECIKFLSNTVKAMEKNYSRLLINDQVLPDTGTEIHPAVLDFSMLSYFNARERTEGQWRVLLRKVGVEVVRIWWVGSGSEAVIEGMIGAWMCLGGQL